MRISKNEESKDGYKGSLANQEDLCLKVARNLKLKESQLTIIQEDISSFKSGKRPEFKKMIEQLEDDMMNFPSPHLVEKREYGGIIFFKVDRLARNYHEFEKIDRLFNEGYELISATETIENTPTGRLLLRVLAGFAIYESDKLSSRQTIAQLHNLIKKKFCSLGGKTPSFGYKRLPKKAKDDEASEYESMLHEVVINEEEAQIIRDMYHFFLDIYKETGKIDYKKITEKINTLHNKNLTNKRVRNIIINKSSIQYHGIYARNIKVNDEIVREYISRIMETDDLELEFEGTNIIGGKMKFVFSLPNYSIMGVRQYYQVQEIIENEGSKQSSNFGNIYSILYDVLEYHDLESGKVHKPRKPDVQKRKDKQYINHRFENNDSLGISEKKLLQGFYKSKLKNKLSKVIEKDSQIKEDFLDAMKGLFDDERRSSQMEFVWRDRELKRFEELFSMSESSQVDYFKEAEEKRRDIKELRIKIEKMNEEKYTIVSDMIDILTTKDIANEPREIQKKYMIMMFDKVVLTSNMTVKYYVNPLFAQSISLSTNLVSWKIK